MILPDKNRLLAHSLLGMGAELLTNLESPQTVSSLWDISKKSDTINSYEKYILTLDLLYLLDLIALQDGLLRKKKHA